VLILVLLNAEALLLEAVRLRSDARPPGQLPWHLWTLRLSLPQAYDICRNANVPMVWNCGPIGVPPHLQAASLLRSLTIHFPGILGVEEFVRAVVRRTGPCTCTLYEKGFPWVDKDWNFAQQRLAGSLHFVMLGYLLVRWLFSFKASTTINCTCLPSTTDIPA
jgi:hypothetical protein